jgi:hypothetical protein
MLPMNGFCGLDRTLGLLYAALLCCRMLPITMVPMSCQVLEAVLSCFWCCFLALSMLAGTSEPFMLCAIHASKTAS